MVGESERGSGRPWEQRADEGAKPYAAFRAFLELGPERTVQAAAQTVKKSESLVWRWASAYRWRERARAWDEEVARQREVDLREHRRELLERRLRRAREADAVGRLLVNRGLPRDAYSGEVHNIDRVALRHGERYLRLATEVEDRCLAGTEPEAHETRIEEELWRSEDAALRRLIDEVRGTQGETGDGNDG